MADPSNEDNVLFVSNWDGSDGDTSYTAEIGGAVTFEGSAELDTSQTRFTKATLLTDFATRGCVTWGSQASLQFLSDRSKHWTIEAWVRCTDLSHENHFIGTRNAGIGINLYLNTGGTVNLIWRKNSGSVVAQAISSSGAVTANTWHYIKAVYNHDSARVRLYIDGVLDGTDTTLQTVGTPVNTNDILHIGDFPGSWTGGVFEGNIGPVRITEGEALEDTDVPTGIFPGGTETNSAWLSAPSALLRAKVLAVTDFSALVTDTREFYVLEIAGDPVLRIPISTWQATMQLDEANYLQATIPAADEWVDDLAARLDSADFYVSRITIINGQEMKSELARARFESSSYNLGNRNATVTISGYGDPSEAPAVPATRELRNPRTLSTSSTGTTRVRCDIDWFFRPGDVADIDGDTFTAHFINFYVPTEGDIYMDVGDRQ